MSLIRLQKALADAGVGSRRECEQLIADGRVDVDREVVTQLGSKVDPATQLIRVDGVQLKQKKRTYFAVHKPPGVLSTSKDQWRRTRVIDLVAAKDRVFTIGRLDKASSGLILVTNDGEFANRVTHPRYKIEKTYHVTVAGVPKAEVLQKIRRGVSLSDGRVKPVSIVIKKRLKQSSLLEIVLAEGRNREIRRMLARFDHKVVKLRRVAIGNVRLGDLPVGSHRQLTRKEVNQLTNLSEAKSESSEKPRKSRSSKASRSTSRSISRSTTSRSTSKLSSQKNARSGAKAKTTKKTATKTTTKRTATKKTGSKKTTKKKTSTLSFGRPKAGAVIGGDGRTEKPEKTAKRKKSAKPKKTRKPRKR